MRLAVVAFVALFGAASVGAVTGCGTNRGTRGGGGGGGGGSGGGGGGGNGGCTGLECYQVACTGGGTTSVSGKVMAPNGIDPVVEALVYVPRDLPEFPATVQCEACNNPIGGNPIVQAVTAVDGSFTLTNVPATSQVPVVVQKGRFRRTIMLNVTACQDHPLTIDQARLPKNQQEGDLPKMAVGLGTWDQIECVLRSIGIDQSEFTKPSGNGAVHLYENGSALSGGDSEFTTMLQDKQKLESYNLVFVNCTNNYLDELASKATIKQNLFDYVSAGGRLYVTDYSYDYLEQVPQFSPYLYFTGGGSQTMPQAPQGAHISHTDVAAAKINDPTLAEWVKLAHPSQGLNADGTVQINDLWIGIESTSTDPTYASTTWVQGSVGGKTQPLSVTFDYNSCGKVLYSNYHTREPGGADAGVSFPGLPSSGGFPSYCASTAQSMIVQEKILEYLIFSISSCVGPIG